MCNSVANIWYAIEDYVYEIANIFLSTSDRGLDYVDEKVDSFVARLKKNKCKVGDYTFSPGEAWKDQNGRIRACLKGGRVAVVREDMNFIRGIIDRWKTVSTEFEQDMDEFLIDFEKFFKGNKDSKTKQDSPTTTGTNFKLQPPKEEEDCEDGGKKYKVGESWTNEGECTLKVCHPRKVISVRKCPEWSAPAQCRQQNLFKTNKFPDCCPSIICPVPQSS